MIEPESCPFRGKAAKIYCGNERGELYVIAMCCSCGIRTRNFYYTNNITERNDAIMIAAKQWNRRVNDGRGI